MEAIKYYKMFDDCTLATGVEKGAIEMAEWKDEQFAQEKQQWIDKACEWIKKLMVASGNYDAYDMQENLRDFKNAMKGE